MCVCAHMYIWMILWAPNWNIRIGRTTPTPPLPLWCDHLVVSRLIQTRGMDKSVVIQPHAIARSRVLDHPDTFRQVAGEMWSFLMFPLIGKKDERVNWLLDLGIWQFPSFCDQRSQPTKGERGILYFRQAPRQSWIIYLFCNSFLSNILFLSLVIKNWNASFSVDVLALSICLTLHKLFNLSEPVYLSVSTVSDTT